MVLAFSNLLTKMFMKASSPEMTFMGREPTDITMAIFFREISSKAKSRELALFLELTAVCKWVNG